jgi:HAD superfamily hydrolase (TIGR01509 family)
MIRGLVFDFDGLVLDTEWPDFLAWQEVYAERGQDLPMADWLEQVGMGADLIEFDPYGHLEALIGERLEREQIRARRRERVRELVAGEATCPGVREYVAEARELGLKLAVASSSSRRWVRGHLERLGLYEAFDCVRCAEDVARTKPDPELYRSAVECLGLRPQEALALEDSPNGLRAAKAAGLRCVVVPNRLTRGLCFADADLVLGALSDRPLADLLLQLDGDDRRSTVGRDGS